MSRQPEAKFQGRIHAFFTQRSVRIDHSPQERSVCARSAGSFPHCCFGFASPASATDNLGELVRAYVAARIGGARCPGLCPPDRPRVQRLPL